MGDRVSSFTITFDGEAGTVKSVLAGLKSQIKSDVSDIQATADKLDVFKNLQQQAKDAASAFFSTKARVEDLRVAIDAIKSSGGVIGRDLINSLKEAERAAASARKEFDNNRDRLAALRGELQRAGVDTRNLAAEQQRLAVAAAEAAGKQALGFKTLRDVQPELDRLRVAYDAVRKTGNLTFSELATLQGTYQKRVAEVRSSVQGIGTAFQGVQASLASFTAAAAGIGLTIGGIAAALKAAIESAHAFDEGIARIGVITKLTKAQLDELGEGARAISRDLGIDVNDALKGLFELIRSGVPPDNAIAVLRIAAEAAKAGLSDLDSGIKASNLLIEGFGLSLKDLPLAFDKIITASHSGGLTLKEFAENAGPLLTVARAAGIGFDDLLATLTVLVDKTGNAELAVQSLTKIIAKLDTTAAREKLRELGIQGDTLVSIFSQIGAKGLGLHEILDLGVASAKSAAGVSALTKNANELTPALNNLQTASGATAEGLAKVYDTPKERAARFNAAISETSRLIGEQAGSGSRLVAVLTGLVNGYNAVYGGLQRLEGSTLGTVFVRLPKAAAESTLALFGIKPAADQAGAAVKSVGTAILDTGDKSDRLVASLNRASTSLGDFSTKLAEDVAALQSAATRDVGDIDARANAQIAALDRTRAAIAASAAAQLDIEQKAAAARLAVIQKAEADINAALEKEIAARIVLARKAGQDEAKIAADVAQLRIEKLAPVLALYQAHYNALIQQAQRYASQVESIERTRVEIQRTIQQEINAIRLEGLSGLDQFVEKNKQIDALISQGRRAAAQGDVDAAKQFFEQALQESKGLTKVINDDGVEIVTTLQARTAKTDALKKISDAVNQSFGDQGDAAKRGLEKTKIAIESARGPLQELQDKYDALKHVIGEGLLIKLRTDAKSVNDALATINEVAKDRIVTIRVRTVDEQGNPVPVPISQTPEGAPLTSTGGGNGEHFAHGGYVRGFAGGGSVFRRPTYARVPGVGNQDTVPALLNAGSFVVRQAASQFYGDALMRKVARGYAAGGSVFGMNDRSNGTTTPAQIKKFAESKWGFDPFSSPVYDPGGIGNRVDKGGSAPTGDQYGEFTSFHSGQSFQDKFEQRVYSLDSRPIPEALITAVNVIQYAKEMLNSVGQNNPLLGSLAPSLLDGIRRLEQKPTDANLLKSVLQAAETIGANPYLFAMWGKTAGSPAAAQVSPTWFIDWLARRGLVGQDGTTGGTGVSLPLNDFQSRFFSQAIPAAGNPLTRILFGQRGAPSRSPTAPPLRLVTPYAEGGDAGTDTVPAMLTPGEFVVNKPAADRIGAPLLWAINEMRLPKADLSHLLEPPRIPRFASGGYVGIPEHGQRMSIGSGGRDGDTINNITISVPLEDFFSQDTLRRHLIPALNSIKQRSRR